jgi:hypothetical protein
MKFSWMFGSSLPARHLLYSYVAVWLIQGGYGGWVFYQWLRAGRESRRIPGREDGS